MAILPPLSAPVVARCAHGENRNSCVQCATAGARHRARGLVTSPLRPASLGDSAADALFGASLNAVAEHLGDHPKAKLFRGDPKITTPFGLATAVSAMARSTTDSAEFQKMAEACSRGMDMPLQAREAYADSLVAEHRKDVVVPPTPTSTQRESVGIDPRAPYRILTKCRDGQYLYASDHDPKGVGCERLGRARTFRTLAEARIYAARNTSLANLRATRTIHIVDMRMIEVDHGPYGIRMNRSDGQPPLYAPREGNHFAPTEPSEAASFHTLEETRAYLLTLCNWAGRSDVFIVDDFGVEIESAFEVTVNHAAAEPRNAPTTTPHQLGWPAPPTKTVVHTSTERARDAAMARIGKPVF